MTQDHHSVGLPHLAATSIEQRERHTPPAITPVPLVWGQDDRPGREVVPTVVDHDRRRGWRRMPHLSRLAGLAGDVSDMAVSLEPTTAAATSFGGAAEGSQGHETEDERSEFHLKPSMKGNEECPH